MMISKTTLFTSMAALCLTACAGQQAYETPAQAGPGFDVVPNPHFSAIAGQATAAEKDRAAILAMQGDYRVSFDFMETVALEAGYELHEDKNTGGFETVVVVKDAADHVVLQHILVAPGGHVVKHWRQDWYFEAPQRFEFVSDQTWATRPIDADNIDNAWTQCVFEVSDAPRYCGTGRWNHRYGVSTWTSDRSWRPLPRREYTKRSDYNALNAENRHTVTPNGWTHEQDNTKTVRVGEQTEKTLVREYGFNNYRSISGYDFSPATAYWERTHEYWARVRAAWELRLGQAQPLVINTEVDGMPIIEATFGHAERAQEMSAAEQVSAISEVLEAWVTPTVEADRVALSVKE
ncbi:MAG: DUF6607 family protein [Lysobacterales bacterium]